MRARVYIAAVVRCFPGKAKGGGDRVPTPAECARWRGFVEREVEILKPRLVIPVGRLAIQEVLGHTEPIAAVVGPTLKVQFHGVSADAIPLPHPSGASTWFKMEPGRTLLEEALELARAPPRGRADVPAGGAAVRGARRKVAVASLLAAAACAHGPRSRRRRPRAAPRAAPRARSARSASPRRRARRSAWRASTAGGTTAGAPPAAPASTCTRSPARTAPRRSGRGCA